MYPWVKYNLNGLEKFLKSVTGVVTSINWLLLSKNKMKIFYFHISSSPFYCGFVLGCNTVLHVFYLANLNEIIITLDCIVTPPDFLGGMYENKKHPYLSVFNLLGIGLRTSGMRISTKAWYIPWSQLHIHFRIDSCLHRVISFAFGSRLSISLRLLV